MDQQEDWWVPVTFWTKEMRNWGFLRVMGGAAVFIRESACLIPEPRAPC